MHPENLAADFLRRLTRWPLLCALLGVALARAAMADALYENDLPQDYTVPGNPPPDIHATNFVNKNTFEVNFDVEPVNPEMFETYDTLNYTNNKLMVVNSELGGGFLFDLRPTGTSSHLTSSSFYNPGAIRCDSIIDEALGIGQLIVQATNIISPGTIDVGASGLVQITGDKVDLTHSSLTVEIPAGTGLSGIDYGVGTDTNGDWDPSIYLQPTEAISSEFNSQLFPKPGLDQILVFPSTPYFRVTQIATNYTLTRAVFISPNAGNSNVVENVYLGDNANPDLGSGFTTIEFVGSYVDPVTGQSETHYLYLKNGYLEGANTNNPIANGIPSNFTFTELNAPATFSVAPATSQFPVFSPGIETNNYSYVDLQLSASTVATNSPSQNVTNYLAILAGRTQITANKELDMSLANISGQNYLSINAPNQFDGSVGAQIFSPYSDINIGKTNGFMAVTNLLEPAIPDWNGTVQAWTSDWFDVVTNTLDGTNFFAFTNEFRVLLVNPSLNPTTLSQVQDLTLHATNSLVISDTLNVMRTFSSDAQSLTLTANGPNAASPDGELNLQSTSFLWSNSLPNLLYLTNNGSIRIPNFAQFGGHSNIVAVTPGIPAVAATAQLSEMGGVNPVKNATVTIGTQKYAFELTLTNATANQVKIAGTFDGSMSNLIAAINQGTGAGANYSSATVASTQVTAGLLSEHIFTVTAVAAGSAGNSIAIATSATNLTWNGQPHLSGGADAVAGTTNVSSTSVPYVEFINNGLISDQGSAIWADDFENSGVFSNGAESFVLQSLTTTLTNGAVFAGGDVSITTGALLASNVVIQAAQSLTLIATNLLTDGIAPGSAVLPNGNLIGGNIWTVGTNSAGAGLNMPVKPAAGDLFGTTITNYAPLNENVINIWAGRDFGASTAGYTNNVAVGRLILDSMGTAASPPPRTEFTFNGAGVSNAMYVDYLELRDWATNRDASLNVTSLNTNGNLVIYYARAVINGFDVSEKLNHKNNDHLRWVPSYLGIFSSTNVVYPDGTTNTVNIALAQSSDIDSDGDGNPNSSDSTPFFASGMVDLSVTVTNLPPMSAAISWNTIPLATNSVFYTTNLLMVDWMVLTNFISPIAYPSPATTVTIYDPLVNPPRYYKVEVNPWLTYPF